jgi:uncharacterized glyoxalase superfamily protein PhnB/uncharacterized protein YndB with AHSA1/START domain
MDFIAYLGFDGRCEEAFLHYEKVFRGKLLMMLRMGDAPIGVPVPDADKNRIMHARLDVGGRWLMGGDAPTGKAGRPEGFSVNVMVDGPAEAERIFRDLSEGGTIRMPMAESFWARRFGMLVDRFNVPWMVNCLRDETAQETPLAPFSLSRTFDVGRDALWQCFTDAAHLERWWGPKGARVVSAKMDFKPGGTFLYGLRMPDGGEIWGRFLYREIAPRERTVHVNAFSDPHGGLTRHPLAPQWPIEMLSTFTFADAGPGRTTLTVTWTPIYPTKDEAAAFEAGFDSMRQGWSGTLEQLDGYLKTL